MKEKSLKISLLLVSLALVLSLFLNVYLVMEDHDFQEKAAAIFVNDVQKVIVKNEKVAQDVLNSIKSKYIEGEVKEYEFVGFIEDVRIESIKTTEDNILSAESAKSILTSKEKIIVNHTIQLYDTPDTICSYYKMSRVEFDELNPKFEDNYYIGGQVLVKSTDPGLSVKTVKVVTFTEKIPYNYVSIESDQYYIGSSVVLHGGKNGEKEITAQITKINGFAAGRVDLNTEVLVEPEDGIIAYGTKAQPAT